MLSRRHLLSFAPSLVATGFYARPASATSNGKVVVEAQARIAQLENQYKGRLGIALMNLSTGALASHRGDERFLFNSTAKFFIAASVLSQIDRGLEKLDRRIIVTKSDLGGWTPITEKQLGKPGMTVAELCEAAVTWSDNAAANVLITSLGGPSKVTDYLRSIGDTSTRLDRMEPALNEHDYEGDERDTTTPLAMMQTLRTLLLEDALSPHSRHQLAAWMINGKTGDKRLRAGMPKTWLVGEKTGTNGIGNANDIGIAWPYDRGAVIAVAYTYLPKANKDERDQVIAEIGRITANI
ncbi:MAG: class A beta-lactamase [Advenella sp.]|uniref:class A beta-lactamase n=1 Tax=Advenella sp. TaxID=1872388 RepID=UPI003F9AE82F